MALTPVVEEFRRQLEALRKHPILAGHVRRRVVHFGELSQSDVAQLLRDDAAHYFLLAAAGLNRTTLKRATAEAKASIVAKPLRKAFAVKEKLPIRASFADVLSQALVLRRGDLERVSKGGIEQLFRDRLAAEGIGILMAPPLRQVPGLLIARRKPDGVYPDPDTDRAPLLYLEIKNVRRVADDIQKRLYEMAEASLEMKFLYGSLELRGLGMTSTKAVLESTSALRAKLQKQIRATRPTVVALFLCSREQAERYREGAQAFIDRVFFQEEIEECLAFLKQAIAGAG